MTYTVTAGATKTDGNYRVEGTITVTNPSTATANGVNVTDSISGVGAVSVDCNGDTAGTGLPASIAPGGTLNCTYSHTYGASAPSGEQTNTATATTTTAGIGSGSGEAKFDFANAVLGTETDECFAVVDDMGTPNDATDDRNLGTVCANQLVNGEYTFPTYIVDVVDKVGGCAGTYHNIATGTENDTGQTRTDDHTVVITCRDEGNGCTLTQGYWKTHSIYGPAKKADAGWANVGGPDAQFFGSGKTWLQVFNTAPQGNAYYILAHQYMAAKLNVLAGASAPQNVLDALAAAEAFFASTSPAQGAALKGAAKNAIIALATTLASYNEGFTGPGHCDNVAPDFSGLVK